ncbi:LysR family transcriptional regulator [Burkholderia sp. Bp9142]|uniref:LysR family transcriptional regulator n=1 Tax=Burkholderia sp. Bp9142 TaxID=2184573 RepID=UPI000F5AC892|nr:LysR family transcriptional regulator [Burkholderia sp. Bp9142]RQR23272.1 LysR family transcriptional regulator [Burkholderia sp. Bp9142]
MEAKWLEDFLSLAETRSFSRAADDRHLTQSALSRRIAALESWLGAKLIDRTVSPIRLTSTGIMFRGQAADILRDIYAARTLAQAHELVADGVEVVRLSVVHTLLFTFVPGRLRQLRDELEHIKTKVQAVNVPDGVQALVEGDTDLFVAYHHPQLPILLDANRFPFLTLGVDRLLPISAADGRGEPIYRLPGENHDAVPFMAYAPGTFLGNVVEMLILNAPSRCSLRRTFEAHMSEAVKAMVIAGNGLGWLPRSCIAKELDNKIVAVAGSDSWATDLEIRIYRTSECQNTAAEEMWNWMSRHRAA